MAKNQGQTRGQRANNASAAGGAAAPARKVEKLEEPRMVRATQRGYADGIVREPGEVFATQAPEGSWMEELGKGKKGKDARLSEAVDDTMSSKKDDPDLTTFSMEALQAEALRLGLTDATGLSKDDLIAAIRAAYVNQAQ